MAFLREKLNDVATDRVPSRYLLPLFWQHGESREALVNEINAMHSSGMAGFILESRPYPGFLSEAWFDTVAFILREAAARNMKVYLFDDCHFPSGYANGVIAEKYPQYLRWMLRMDCLDAVGPRPGVSLSIAAWKKAPEDRFFRVVAVKMSASRNSPEAEYSMDLTDFVIDGTLYWDLPPGHWRICIFHQTREGGENHTRDYLNPLRRDAVRCYIDIVYEAHYQRFGREFGRTFMGFFSDEPRFGNVPSYEAALGKLPMVIPFDEQLPARLNAAAGEDFSRFYPWLWFGSGDCVRRARFLYMDTVSRLYSENFPRQIGAWCREHGIEYLGHVVEDNGAHARLGYGAGHFFRALDGQSMAGIDTVLLQNMPGFTDGEFPTPFGPPLDARFFHWGLGKLGSSCGHLNPAMHGNAFCEIFGAYGWNEGLRMMKWLTDHFLVRGINRLIPHAFSPKEFPDPDCPPHFYANGHNPQWRLFPVWSRYANTLCHLLSDGIHQATAAVLYHAEAEWTGADYEPFECAVQALGRGNIDCDVVCLDLLEKASVQNNRLKIAQEFFDVLVVPYAQAWPSEVETELRRIAEAGVPLVWLREKKLPLPGDVVEPGELAALLIRRGWYDFTTSPAMPELRACHFRFEDGDVYFLVNENIHAPLNGSLLFRQAAGQFSLDPASGQWKEAAAGMEFSLHLAPSESCLLFRGIQAPECIRFACPISLNGELPLPESWRISISSAEEYPVFTLFSAAGKTGNLALPGRLPRFSGTIRYQGRLQVPDGRVARVLDLGEVHETAELTVDGRYQGIRIGPPYHFPVKLEPGIHELQIDVTNTLGKKCSGNFFDRGTLQDPSGLIGPLRLFTGP